jgi:hypothetical protein
MVTFAPSFSNYRKHVAGLVPVAVILLVVDYFRIRQPLPIYVAECIVLVGLGVGFGALYFRNTKINAERHSLTITNLFGATREVSGDRLAQAVLVQNLVVYGSGTPLQQLLILDSEGKPALKWNGMTWTQDQMGTLVGTLGIPLHTISDPISPADLKKAYPRAVSSFVAHPVWWGLGLSLVIIVIIVVVAIAVVGLG